MDASSPLCRPVPGSSQPRFVHQSQCLISFGSNLGDRHDLIAAAAREIATWEIISKQHPLVTSRLFETPPIGGPAGQEPFLNAVGAFETAAPAREVLRRLQYLEDRLGRRRRRRWDARSIDLDVVLHGRLVGGATGLVVPHPRYTARRFVLLPACDVVPHFRDPRFGWTMRELSEHLAADVPSLALVTGGLSLRQAICERLETEHGITYHRDPASFECKGSPWVTCSLPDLPNRFGLSRQLGEASLGLPRLLVRLQMNKQDTPWPAPHLMWPGGWGWPEYRLETSEIDWAVSELASSFDSMRCDANPVSHGADWWSA